MSLTFTRRTLCMGLAPLVLLLFQSMNCPVVADDNSSSSEPNQESTVEQVLQRLEQVEAKLHSFRVHCLSNTQRQSMDVRVNGDGPERIFGVLVTSRATTNSVWHYRDDGSSRFDADGRTWRARSTQRWEALQQVDLCVFQTGYGNRIGVCENLLVAVAESLIGVFFIGTQ